MKKILWIIPAIFLAATACVAYMASTDAGYGVGGGGAYAGGPQEFGAELDINYCYDYLSPFGSWINLDPYGYVWTPRHMGYRWRPYGDGHWVWTDYGWTWISDFDWGWMPFHYGRWGWDDECGWFWVPGTVWGPAWVTWRYSDLYMGWAPIPPGIEFRAGMDFASLSLQIPGNFWIFIGGPHFLDPDIHPYVLPYERNSMIVSYTTGRNNFFFRSGRFVNEGIDVETVRRATRREVLTYRLADINRPGEGRIAGNEVQLYRPNFRGNAQARPKDFLNRDQARRELAPAKVYELPRQAPAVAPESAVKKRQAEERALLEQSQSQERQNLQRRRDQTAQQAQSSAEKAKAQQDYQSQMSQVQKQHQAEKQQMNQRHQRDTQQVRQQQAPPPPKKKK
jgi:hypothetical protein